MDRFRLVVPELVTFPSESIPDHDVQRQVDSVLWRGEDHPGQDVIDAAIEGQVYNARQRLETLPDPNSPQRVGNQLLIQHRRTRLLGWKTIDLVNIPESL
jgi:hypothetical protein